MDNAEAEGIGSTWRKRHLTQLPTDYSVWISVLTTRVPHILILVSPAYKPSFPKYHNSSLRSYGGGGGGWQERVISEKQLCYTTQSNAGQGSNICRNGSVLCRSLSTGPFVIQEKKNSLKWLCNQRTLLNKHIYRVHSVVRHLVALSARKRKLQSGYQIQSQPLPKDSQPCLEKKTYRKKKTNETHYIAQ